MDFGVVVTNVVNPRAFSLKMAVFGLRLTTFVTGVLARRFELRWFDDVCNVGCPPVARPGPASAHGHRSLALSARWAGLKPPSPLLARACVGLKPSSPLRVRNGCFWCSFRVQRRWRFQWLLFRGEQWCCWFQSRHVVAPRARKSSPCALKTPQNRRLFACWASFFADRQAWDPTGRVCCNAVLAAGPSTGSVNPSMRSYTHLVEAGRGRPTDSSNRPRNAKR